MSMTTVCVLGQLVDLDHLAEGHKILAYTDDREMLGTLYHHRGASEHLPDVYTSDLCAEPRSLFSQLELLVQRHRRNKIGVPK